MLYGSFFPTKKLFNAYIAVGSVLVFVKSFMCPVGFLRFRDLVDLPFSPRREYFNSIEMVMLQDTIP